MLATIKTYHNSNFNPSQTKIRKARSSLNDNLVTSQSSKSSSDKSKKLRLGFFINKIRAFLKKISAKFRKKRDIQKLTNNSKNNENQQNQ